MNKETFLKGHKLTMPEFCDDNQCARLDALGMEQWIKINNRRVLDRYEFEEFSRPAYLLQQAFEFLAHQHRVEIRKDHDFFPPMPPDYDPEKGHYMMYSRFFIYSNNGNPLRKWKSATVMANLNLPFSILESVMVDLIEQMIQVAEQSVMPQDPTE